ncbi:hypothetical protein GQ53DRAFT_848516 [Thozetella sp. PMI_491]|nr:hypothetical protein GQ53DRAFT_848516 [Thozetella sp. PMI_491]
MIKTLLHAGADCNATDKDGKTILNQLVMTSDLLFLSKFLTVSRGRFDCSERDRSGMTPLHYAAQPSVLSTFWFLADVGADCNVTEAPGRTALHNVVLMSDLYFLRKFLRYGGKRLDLSKPDSSGLTPLHYAAQQADLGSFQRLADAGANLTAKDDSGATPIDYAGSKAIADGQFSRRLFPPKNRHSSEPAIPTTASLPDRPIPSDARTERSRSDATESTLAPGSESSTPQNPEARDVAEMSGLSPATTFYQSSRLGSLPYRSALKSPRSLAGSSTFRTKSAKADRSADPLGLTLLYAPEGSHTADVVFVHGLGGSSRLTWCKHKDLELFWPQRWLPLDRDIQQARILTFGYNARFSSSAQSNLLGITDFAKNLLYDMLYGRDLDGGDLGVGQVPIIFVAHSMGGLVFKKAYLEGRLDDRFSSIIDAIKAVVFLSTPHRGSDLSEFLSKVLAISPGSSSKQYVSELSSQGPFLRATNEQFRHVASKLQIFSFYETLETQTGLTSAMIVQGESAKLGYPGEVSRSLNADHHDVCKFTSPQDPNYLVVLGALKSLVSSSISSDEQEDEDDPSGDIQKISGLLSVNVPPDHDLNLFWTRRAENTCDWVVERPEVADWVSGPPASRLLWLHARPARGKSVLSSFLVNLLGEEGLSVQYFFFRAGDETKRSISSLLRSLAFQIALEVPAFRKALANTSQTSWKPKESDWRSTWKKLFVNLLFKMELDTPLFWVIDGLDECGSSQQVFETMSDLQHSATPIHVLVTSRWNPVLSSAFDRLGSRLPVSALSLDHDLTDIQTYTEQELSYLSWDDEIKEQIMDTILKQASDNFLWVRLVLEEIKDCHTEEDVRLQLDGLPSGMNSLFRRMEESISDRKLAQQLLMWAVYSRRSLTLDELSSLLGSEFGKLLDISSTISRLCGGFVVVEGGNQIGLVHQTAREYLTTSSTLPFSLEASESHANLLEKCIFAFNSASLKSNITEASVKNLEYRATSWTSHLESVRIRGDSNRQLDLLIQFFTSTSVLTWIYVLTLLDQLKILIEASRCLNVFIERKSREDAGIDPALRRFEDLELLKAWSRDLLKIPGKFGSNLVQEPSSIYSIVPAFCPQSSAIHQIFAKTSSSLVVKGLPDDWDDCLARILIGGNQAASLISCSSRHLAVVSTAGVISIWDAVTFHKVQLLEHGEAVSALCFTENADRLATYGSATTKIWSPVTGNILQVISNPPDVKALCLQFTDGHAKLLMGSNRRLVLEASLRNDVDDTWNLIDPRLLDDDKSLEGTFLTSPTSLVISPDGTKIAAVYRRYPLTIWSIRPAGILKRVSRLSSGLSQGIGAMPFATTVSWHPSSEELIGIFEDGSTFRLNLEENFYQEKPPEPGQSPVGIQCSPDGTTYAIWGRQGTIKLYDYLSSALIYQLTAENSIRAFCFSRDGRRFYDIREDYSNVWEPNALIRLSAADDHPTFSGGSQAPDESVDKLNSVSESFADNPVPLTVVSAVPERPVFCIGDEDGRIELYDYATGAKRQVGQTPTTMSVDHIHCGEDARHVCYAELRGPVELLKLEVHGDKWKHERIASIQPSLRSDGETKFIQQLLLSPDSSMLLVSTGRSVSVWRVSPPAMVKTRVFGLSASSCVWINHLASSEHLMAISPNSVSVYTWADLAEVAKSTIGQSMKDTENTSKDQISSSLLSESSNPAHEEGTEERVAHAEATYSKGHVLVTVSRCTPTKKLPPHYFVFDSTLLDLHGQGSGNTAPLLPLIFPPEVSSKMHKPLNVLRNDRLVFLDKDFGVCTWHVRGLERAKRHFFIPRDWLTEHTISWLHITRQGTVICHRQGSFVSIQSELAFAW